MKTIEIKDLKKNGVLMFDKEWALVAAKNGEDFNAMTISWGGIGELWNKDVVTIYIRPQRHTKGLLDAQDYFTLSFYDESYRKILSYYGCNSGKDVNKEDATGMMKVNDGDYAYLDGANTVIKCKKLYRGKLCEDNFIEKDLIDKNYPDKDYHYVYIAEIKEIFVKD